jgi:hypothetical protein
MIEDDVEAVAAASARAFYDDPMQVWALPDDNTRLGKLESMFALQTRVAALPLGECYTDDSRSVACFWSPRIRENDARSIPQDSVCGSCLERVALSGIRPT